MITSKLKNIKIKIAEIICLFSSDNLQFIAFLKEKYKNFLTIDSPDIKIEILNYNISKSNTYNFKIRLEKKKIFIKRGKFDSVIDLNLKKGYLKNLNNIYEFNSFLRILYSIFLVEEKGFLLHSASLIRENKGYLFCGQSETGKSTIIKINPQYLALTDEISIIKKKKDGFYIYNSPFWGELSPRQTENINTKVEAIYILHKDKKNFVTKITQKETIIKLVSNIILYTQNLEINKKLLSVSIDFCKKVKAYDLHFLPNLSFWEVIDSAHKL